ncbi:hypothetical protein CSV79_11565 [Sporosarcina sp. P13]|nr:hypothetical protein CSV79_11565 [Sporosarcina sp. P13]
MGKKKSNKLLLFIIIISICSLLALIGFINHLLSPSYKSKKVLEAFYTHEQGGNYADSWALLHPFMKDKWSKTQFMTDRLHVFNGHFGAETFQFTITGGNEINDWKMAEEAEAFDIAYKFTVIQTYKGKYGRFSFLQEVYVANAVGEWRILWDYN